ncbi:hypothetical protein DFJ77DRAFT_159311 [Powellomyces hirtus]|nr:hypothetical protein DFJ77DRAFT_159311 [Powellomyces hirtus]
MAVPRPLLPARHLPQNFEGPTCCLPSHRIAILSDRIATFSNPHNPVNHAFGKTIGVLAKPFDQKHACAKGNRKTTYFGAGDNLLLQFLEVFLGLEVGRGKETCQLSCVHNMQTGRPSSSKMTLQPPQNPTGKSWWSDMCRVSMSSPPCQGRVVKQQVRLPVPSQTLSGNSPKSYIGKFSKVIHREILQSYSRQPLCNHLRTQRGEILVVGHVQSLDELSTMPGQGGQTTSPTPCPITNPFGNFSKASSPACLSTYPASHALQKQLLPFPCCFAICN